MIVLKIFVALFLLVSLYFTIKLDFIQVRYFKEGWVKLLKDKQSLHGISPFSAAVLAVGGRIGTGNIVGVAFAIYLCGYGVLFWMWIASFLAMATSFIEATLSQVYKTYDFQNQFISGPMVYIKRGLPKKFNFFSIIYGVVILFTVGFIFIRFYTSIITDSILAFTGVTDNLTLELIVVFIIALIATYILLGGTKKVAKTLAYIVPVMVITYIFLVIFIALKNLSFIPYFFQNIFSSIFTVTGVAEGGVMIMIFVATYVSAISNEAGFGTSAIASGMATNTHPATQGLINMITIFIDTLVCTLTGFIFMLTLEDGIVFNSFSNTSEIIMHSFDANYSGGAVLLLAIIFVFSFGSIITSATYGFQVIKFMVSKQRIKLIYRLYFSSLIVLILLTPFGDVNNNLIAMLFGGAGMMLFSINIAAIILLRNIAFKTFNHYKRTSLVFKPNELNIEFQDENKIWK